MERKSDYFYLKALPNFKGHVYRIGILGIHDFGKVLVVSGSICSKADNFSARFAKWMFYKNKHKIVVRDPKNHGLSDSALTVLSHLGLFRCLRRQNIDCDYCNEKWQKLLKRMLNGKEKQGAGTDSKTIKEDPERGIQESSVSG